MVDFETAAAVLATAGESFGFCVTSAGFKRGEEIEIGVGTLFDDDNDICEIIFGDVDAGTISLSGGCFGGGGVCLGSGGRTAAAAGGGSGGDGREGDNWSVIVIEPLKSRCGDDRSLLILEEEL